MTRKIKFKSRECANSERISSGIVRIIQDSKTNGAEGKGSINPLLRSKK